MKIITFDDIRKLNIPAETCYGWVDEMLRNKDRVMLPPKTHLNMPGNIFCNVMPSIIETAEGKWGGVKVVTRYPERKPSLDSKILLFNADSGDIKAILDGNWITAMRTGAVAAHSVCLLAKKDYAEIGMIGLGNTARSTLLVLLSVVKNRKLHIKLLRYKDQAELFAERFKDYGNVEFTYVSSYEDAVKGSDIVISCATYFENDICDDSCFKEGVLVVPVHTRGFTNCDLFFDKVFADDTGHVDHFKNFAKFKKFAEVSDVLYGRAEGRENDSERILAYNIGLSIHDIFYSLKIYGMLENDKNIADIDMKDPDRKFWI